MRVASRVANHRKLNMQRTLAEEMGGFNTVWGLQSVPVPVGDCRRKGDLTQGTDSLSTLVHK